MIHLLRVTAILAAALVIAAGLAGCGEQLTGTAPSREAIESAPATTDAAGLTERDRMEIYIELKQGDVAAMREAGISSTTATPDYRQDVTADYLRDRHRRLILMRWNIDDETLESIRLEGERNRWAVE